VAGFAYEILFHYSQDKLFTSDIEEEII